MSLPLYPISIVGESLDYTGHKTHSIGNRNFLHLPSFDYDPVLKGEIRVLIEAPLTWKELNDMSATEDEKDMGIFKHHWNDIGFRPEGKVVEIHEYCGNTHTVDYWLLPSSKWAADNIPYWVNDRTEVKNEQKYDAEPVSLTVVDGVLVVSPSDGIPVVDAVRFTD